MGKLTHCGDEAADFCLGTFASTRKDEEEDVENVEYELEAIASDPPSTYYYYQILK